MDGVSGRGFHKKEVGDDGACEVAREELKLQRKDGSGSEGGEVFEQEVLRPVDYRGERSLVRTYACREGFTSKNTDIRETDRVVTRNEEP